MTRIGLQRSRVVLIVPDTWREFAQWTTAMGLTLEPVTAGPGQLQRYHLSGRPQPGSAPDLTARELESLTLLAQGLTNREIGERLFVSVDTVKTHVSRMLRKLGARDRAHAVDIAHRLGLLSGSAARLETQELARVLTECLGRNGSDRILAELGRAS